MIKVWGLVGLLLLLGACGSSTPGFGGACTTDFRSPSLNVYAPISTAPGPLTYVATAPSQLVVESNGTYGSSSCPSYLSTLSLVVNGEVFDTQTRSPAAAQTPFQFVLKLDPGQRGIPASGETTWNLALRGEPSSVNSDRSPVLLKILVR